MEWKKEASELRLAYSDLLIEYGKKTSAYASSKQI